MFLLLINPMAGKKKKVGYKSILTGMGLGALSSGIAVGGLYDNTLVFCLGYLPAFMAYPVAMSRKKKKIGTTILSSLITCEAISTATGIATGIGGSKGFGFGLGMWAMTAGPGIAFDFVLRKRKQGKWYMHNELGWFRRGNALQEIGNYEKAIECYDKSLKFDFENEFAWTNRGIALAGLGKYDDAIECYKKAVGGHPENWRAWSNWGNALNYLGRKEEALQCYDTAFKINPTIKEVSENKEKVLKEIKKKEVMKNLASYDLRKSKRALRHNPKDEKAWFKKGVSLYIMEKPYDALEAYERALDINSEYEEAWVNKGLIFNEIKQHDIALECFDEAIEINPDNEIAWYNKGKTLQNMGKEADAVFCYGKVRKINPDFKI